MQSDEQARAIRQRALRALVIMALASSPLIWVKLRLVTGIPKVAYAASAAAAPSCAAPPQGAAGALLASRK
jgi:hypothetical protein